MKNTKNIEIILLICIIAVLLIISVLWLTGRLETFDNKRNTRVKIYKSNEIFDPDEAPEYDEYDPDDNPMIFDPDQQPMTDEQPIPPPPNFKLY